MGRGNNYGDRSRDYGGDSRERYEPRPPPRQSYSPPIASQSAPETLARVIWFNDAKGFGFVELVDGSGDAFLHVRQVQAAGRTTLNSGATLTVRVGPGQKGSQVTEILQVDEVTAAPADGRWQRDAPKSPAIGRVEGHGDRVKVTGTVKNWNADRGFGFVAVPGQPKDVFVHVSALAQVGLSELQLGQRVTVQIVSGRKGPEAGSIELN
jgi:cold shock protein